jgi:hypothetical protein
MPQGFQHNTHIQVVNNDTISQLIAGQKPGRINLAIKRHLLPFTAR